MLMTTEYTPEDQLQLQQLLLNIAGGEREALAELYQRTKTAVHGLALSYLKNAHDAQDLTQDVYVQVWNCAEQYRPAGSPIGWLLTVCRNLCLMHLRREKEKAALSEEEWDAIPAQACGLDADECILLLYALAALGDEERRIVLLHAVTGMKHREIAALLELPLPTVLSKYHRALKKLEKLINAITELMHKIGIHNTIREYGVSEEAFLGRLDEMVEQAFDDQCTGTNPRYPLMKEIKEMYLNAYYGG